MASWWMMILYSMSFSQSFKNQFTGFLSLFSFFGLVLHFIKKNIYLIKCYRNGVVVDGFPRTATQAKWLTKFYNDQCDLSLLV